MAARSKSFFGGLALVAVSLFALVALVSYRASDPSLNTQAAGPVRNWMGAPGAWLSDFLLMLMGPPAALLLPVVFLIGLRLARGVEPGRWGRALTLSFLGIALIGAAAGLFAGGAVKGLVAGWGGAIGLGIASLIELALGAMGDASVTEPFRIAILAIAAAIGAVLCLASFGLTQRRGAGSPIASSTAKPLWRRMTRSPCAARPVPPSSRPPSRAIR